MDAEDSCPKEDKQADKPRQCGDDQQNNNEDVQQSCQDAEQPQQSPNNVGDSQKCCSDTQQVSNDDSEEQCQEANEASASSGNDQQTSCAKHDTKCKEKCLNKKPPSKRPPRCPDHSVDSFHPDLRVQNYLYLENNRLYCHNIFNTAGRRVWDAERKNPKYSCFWPISSECYRKRAASLAIAAHKQWVENHQKRNEAYTANVLCVFHTNNWNAYQPGKNFAIKLIPVRKRC